MLGVVNGMEAAGRAGESGMAGGASIALAELCQRWPTAPVSSRDGVGGRGGGV